MTGKDDNTHMTGKDDNNTHVMGKVWENTRMARENFDKGLILYDRRKMWRLMCFYTHFMCHSYKTLNELNENKDTNEPQAKNGMQVWERTLVSFEKEWGKSTPIR